MIKNDTVDATLRAGWARLASSCPRLPAVILAALSLGVCGARADIYLFNSLAGNGAALDHTDGSGTNARFFNPTGVAVDSSGNIYIADGGDHTIRKITSGGSVSTFAGASGQAGNTNGTGGGARFVYPYAIAVDTSGNLYVTDTGDNTIRKITPGGSTSTIAGQSGTAGFADGVGTNAQFNGPCGIAVDSTGNVWVADTNNSTIRKISTTGVVSTFAGAAQQTGTADGVGGGARFNFPEGLAIDSVGNLYIADFDNSSIRKIDTGGTVTTVSGTSGQTGITDGPGGAAHFDHPAALAVDGGGNIYVIDTSNQTVRKINTSGTVSTLAGSPGLVGAVDGSGATARFFYPLGIGVTSAGTVYVADTGNHSIRMVSATGAVSTFAGSVGVKGAADGSGSSAQFAYPNGVAVDGGGNVYVADHDNNTIRKIVGNSVSTLAGSSTLRGSADGQGSVAQFNGPNGVAVDGNGNVYVADSGNHVIRKITSGGAVSTFAGTAGASGGADGVGAGARFNNPMGVAVDTAGNVYVADTNNCAIRKITTTGIVTTLAGALGQVGNNDGTGGGARFNGPYAVAVDGSGNVYVADFFNNTIRKVTSTGTVSTIAGLAGQSGMVDGPGSVARFNQTYGIAVDPSGNVLVTDTYNRAIRRISGGNVSTIGGTSSRFYYPQGIAADSAGNLYISDGDNQSITKATFVATPASGQSIGNASVTAGQNATFTVAAGSSGTTYQWQFSTNNGATWTNVSNDANDSGATTNTLTITGTNTGMSGRLYRVQLANAAGTGTSASGALIVAGGTTGGGTTGTARITNLSVRTLAGGTNSLAVGFAIKGTGAKQMLIRGIGPTLAQFGVTNPIAATSITLYNTTTGTATAVAANTGWGSSATLSNAFAANGAFALPANSADSVLYQPLAAGTYSTELNGANGATGLALAEFYDADTGTPGTRLINASTRAQVGTGANVLIAGFYVNGTGTEQVLIRGIGPTLSQFGVTGTLAQPQLALVNSSGAVIASNTTGWGGSATLSTTFSQVGAFALPAGSADAAILTTLSPGLYTVQLNGANGGTGNGLIEIYEVP